MRQTQAEAKSLNIIKQVGEIIFCYQEIEFDEQKRLYIIKRGELRERLRC